MESPKASEATDIITSKTQSRTFGRFAPWIVLSLVCLGLYFNNLGGWAFTDPGESYYTEAAREMVECNDWIVPHLNYQIYFSKPILTFWLIAASYKMFGVSELAARLPFALAATVSVFATYIATKRLINGRVALLAALIAAGTPLNLDFARTSPIDLLFCTCLNVAVLGFCMSVFAGSFPWACALWAALGLAVITKGPAGIVFFALGTALFLVMEKPPLKTLWQWFLATRPVVGLPIFAIIAAPWYWAVWRATKGLFLHVFIEYENFARLAGKTNIHKSSWFFFLPVLAYGFAPWSLILAQTIKITLGEPFVERWFGAGRLVFKSTYRPHMKASASYAGTADDTISDTAPGDSGEGKASKKTAKEENANTAGANEGSAGSGTAGKAPSKKARQKTVPKPLPPAEIERLSIYYLACWSLAVFVFFTLSKTQLDTYIEPIMIPLAVLTAATVARLCESQQGENAKLAEKLKFDAKWVSVCAYIYATLSGLTAVACLAGSVMPFMPFYPWHRAGLFIAAIFAGIGAVGQFKILKTGDIVKALTGQAITVAAVASCLVPVVFQVSGHFRQDNMVALARTLTGSKDEIALYGTYMPSAMYYMKRPVDYLSDVGQFTVASGPIQQDGFSYGLTPSGRRQFILADDKHMRDFKKRPELHLVENARKGDWGLYELTNGYAERPRRLEETFRFLRYSKHSFADTESYGPLTVPLGGGDADWFKYRLKKTR